MPSAENEIMSVHNPSRRSINHSFAEKLWKYGTEFASVRRKFSKINLSSSLKALMVTAPAIDSASWLATEDFVVPLIRINSLAEAK